MRKAHCLLIAIFCCIAVVAQPLTGQKFIPGDYPDLQSAINDLNTNGVGAGGVGFNILPGNPQTAPPGGYAVTVSENDPNKPIFIDGNGNTITASAAHTIGRPNDAIFKYLGTDNIFLEECIIQENPANTVSGLATNNMTEFGIAIFYSNSTDGAKNITIEDCTISLNRNYPNTFGIFSTSRSNANALDIANDITSAGGSNDNLHIYDCNISNVNVPIACIGSLTGAYMTTGLEIGGILPENGNTLTNFGTAALTFPYVSFSTLVNGIYLNNQLNFTITNNDITSSIGGVITNTALRGVYVQCTGTLPTTGSFTNTINNNNLSIRSGAPAAITQGIANEMGNGTVSLSIEANNFHDCDYTVPSSGNLTLISNTGGCQQTQINNNTFTNLSLSTSGSCTFISNTANRPSNAFCDVSSNSIITAFIKTTSGGNVAFYMSTGNSDHSSTESMTNNSFGNVSVTGTTMITGWQSTDGASSARPYGSQKQFIGNVFSGINCGTGSVVVVTIGFSNSDSSNEVASNSINNINSAGAITGILSAGGSQNFSSNILSNFSSSGASLVTAFSVTGGVMQKVIGNKIFDLNGTNAGSTVFGFSAPASSSLLEKIEISNNYIGNLFAPIGSGTDVIRGISLVSVLESSSIDVYFNTIYLNASSTASTFGTSGIFHNGSSIPSSSRLNLANNIIVNISQQKGTARTVAFRQNNFLENIDFSSDNNLLYTGTPTVFTPLFFDNFSVLMNLDDFKNGLYPREQNSVTEMPTFLSTVGNDPGFLHLNTMVPTQAEGGGKQVQDIVIDFDGNLRHILHPDIGADESNCMPNDMSGPHCEFQPLINTCSASDRDLINVFITDQTGVALSGPLMPRIYYRKGTGAWFSQAGDFISGTATSGVWNFRIVNTDVGGVSAGDEIDFYIIAQDVQTTPNVKASSPGVIALDVNTVNTHPSLPFSYSIGSNLGGNFLIGTGEIYPTITSFINAYNSGCLTGPVKGMLKDPSYNTSEIFPITIQHNPYASSINTLTIQPNTGVHTTITGSLSSPAIIKILGEHITIDGIGSPSESLTLVNTNTAVSANIWITEDLTPFLDNPGQPNNIKLLNLTMFGEPAAYGVNASGFSTAPSTIPIEGVSEFTMEDCLYGRVGTCVYGKGTLENPISDWKFNRNTFGPEISGANNITHAGISLHYAEDIKVKDNKFWNFTTSAPSAAGFITTFSTKVTLSKNEFRNITSTGNSSGSSSVSGINMGQGFRDGIIEYNIVSGISNTNNTGGGARGMICSNNLKQIALKIYDNMVTDIHNVQGTSFLTGPAALSIDGSAGGLEIVGNTLHLFGDHPGAASNPSSGVSAAFIFNSSGGNIVAYNNIFTNGYDNTTSTGDKSFAIFCPSFLFKGTIDYNAYNVLGPAGVLGGFSSSNYIDLSQLQAGIGQNVHSLHIPVNYINDLDLHLQSAANPLLFLAGGPLVKVPVDIDGHNRHYSTPTPGIDELIDANCWIQLTGPDSIKACYFDDVLLSAVGTGSPTPIYYQWYVGSTGDLSMPLDEPSTIPGTRVTATETFSFWVRAYNSCTQVYSKTAVLKLDNIAVWTGKVDNNWNNPNNWDGCPPSTYVDVVIPSGGKPRIQGFLATVRNLDIDFGGSIEVVDNSLTIEGNVFNNGAITTITGEIIFNGFNQQNIFGIGSFGNVVVTNGDGVIIKSGSQPKMEKVTVVTGASLTAESPIIIKQ